jgi:tRNA A-37 threonylcarbamoyl transferase component Bud32
MNLTDDEIAHIKKSEVWRKERVSIYALEGGKVVVKGQRPARHPFRYQLLNVMASLANLPLLKAAPAPGDAAAQRIEQQRLKALSLLKLNVPALLHSDDEFIVMQHLIGHSLQHEITQAISPAASLALWEQGLQALANLHEKNAYLSQAFARNLMWHEGQVWFIDFEDDPAQVMSLADAQVRDWLAYLYSTIWLLQNQGISLQQIAKIWRQYAQQLPKPLFNSFQQTARRLVWLRHLPRQRKPWGRDVVIVQAMADFLYFWIQEPTEH